MLLTTSTFSRDIARPVSRLAVGGGGSQVRSGGGGIRTHGGRNRPQRFSRPPRSTTPAPLQDAVGDSRVRVAAGPGSAPGREEAAQQLRAVGRQQAGRDLRA